MPNWPACMYSTLQQEVNIDWELATLLDFFPNVIPKCFNCSNLLCYPRVQLRKCQDKLAGHGKWKCIFLERPQGNLIICLIFPQCTVFELGSLQDLCLNRCTGPWFRYSTLVTYNISLNTPVKNQNVPLIIIVMKITNSAVIQSIT